ncbi:MAG: hypothetical protein NZM03_12490 [Limisphaera sp.]|nr:hypothetical protein [Limisphaera sp.]
MKAFILQQSRGRGPIVGLSCLASARRGRVWTRVAVLLALFSALTGLASAQRSAPIPWDQIGARVGADYKGDGLAVIATAEGARLRCVFQRLEGEAGPEGLWLTSTVANQPQDRFKVTAVGVGRMPDWGLERPRAVARVLSFQG